MNKISLEYTYEIAQEVLTERDAHALNLAISGFGYNMDTMDTMLYTMLGMESECFVEQYENGELSQYLAESGYYRRGDARW